MRTLCREPNFARRIREIQHRENTRDVLANISREAIARRQLMRQSSCTSAMAAGGPMNNRTREMQAATETVSLNTAPLPEAIDQYY